jgi:hypothetical protein
MAPDQIALVRQSFGKVLPDPRDGGSSLLCPALLRSTLSTEALFRDDMAAQGAKVMAAIGTIVRSLDRIEPMLEHIRALARRHVGYGVTKEHYTSVGAALLWTLDQGLGAPTSRTKSGTPGPRPISCSVTP